MVCVCNHNPSCGWPFLAPYDAFIAFIRIPLGTQILGISDNPAVVLDLLSSLDSAIAKS
jgi:hypothetical protein